LRGKHIPKTTTDQRLLDWRGPSDWVHTDPWRVLRIQAEFVEGFGLLAELGQAVSVFGSARTPPGSPEYECAEQIGAGLGELLLQPARDIDTGSCGHRVAPSHRDLWTELK